MPQLITRREALARIVAEVGTPSCLMCAIVANEAGDRWVLHDDDDCLVVLPRYVRRWGQVMVVPKAHAETFGEVDDALWLAASKLAHRSARVVEEVLSPRRCYLASTGSAAGEITQSSTHLHIHVIPLYEPDDKPSSIFSWGDGVYVASSEEWQALQAELLSAW